METEFQLKEIKQKEKAIQWAMRVSQAKLWHKLIARGALAYIQTNYNEFIDCTDAVIMNLFGVADVEGGIGERVAIKELKVKLLKELDAKMLIPEREETYIQLKTKIYVELNEQITDAISDYLRAYYVAKGADDIIEEGIQELNPKEEIPKEGDTK